MEALENRGYDRIGQQITQAQSHRRRRPTGRAAARAGSRRPRPRRPRRARGRHPRRRSADRIAELHRLHTQGAITDAEFEAKKAQLLEQF